MRIVGILLIAALMVLPVIAAGRIAWSVRSTILHRDGDRRRLGHRRPDDRVLRDLAPGGAIVLVAAGAFAVAALATSVTGRLRTG